MNVEDNPNMSLQRRCIQCLIEYTHYTNHAFFVCESCQVRGVAKVSGEQSFTYRKTSESRSVTERHGEIIRKMGQGRLDANIQVYEVQAGQWDWIPATQSVYFAGSAIVDSNLSGVIEQRQRSDQKQRAKNKWASRLRFIKSFVGMSVVLMVAYTGWEQGWFIIDADPFAIDQGEDIPIPDSLLSHLKTEGHSGALGPIVIEDALINRREWESIEDILQKDLAKNPRQGTELLQWLQVKLLLHEPTISDSPFPAIWLQFALSLHHPEDLGKRVTAMWYLLQGDRDLMQQTLNTCPSDPWCLAYQQAMSGQYGSLDTSIATQLAGEYVLSFEQVDSLSIIASRAQVDGLTELSALLSAESAIQALDELAAAQWLQTLQGSQYQTLRLALWNQRLTPSVPVSVANSTGSDLWLRSTPQTQGGWALEQAGAWLQADDPQANQRIEEWHDAGEWFQGDFETVLLPDCFQLIRSQSAIYAGEPKKALEHLAKIQSTFDDPLLNFWLGLQWAQIDSLRNAITIADSMSPDTPHHWMLKVVIAVQSKNADLLTHALDAVARTDIALLSERTPFQTWVPPFNWAMLLTQAESQFQSGNIQSHYGMVVEWLKGHDPNVIRHADGWATGWIVRAQYAYEKGRFTDAQTYISRFRRMEADSIPGEILSQLINIKIGRGDIAKRELGLIAQRERGKAWGHWLKIGFVEVGAVEQAMDAHRRWYPILPTRNVSADQFFLFDELPHD